MEEVARTGGPGLAGQVRELAARLVRMDPARLDLDLPLPLDSLQAVELRNRLEADFGAAPPLEALLAGISPRQAADSIQVERATTAAVSVADAEAPLSHGQRALWLLHRLAPESAVHNLPVAARLRRSGGAPPSADEVRRALGELVARHPALRTLVREEAEGPRPHLAAVSEALDFASLDGFRWSAERRAAWRADEAHRPFDLGRGPLVRARYLATEGEPELLFVAHHAAADFWSLELLLADLGGLLAGAPRSAPAATYADFARWQQARLAADGERLWEAWRGALAGGPAADPDPDAERLELPADRPRPADRSGRGIACTLEIPPTVGDGVAALAAATGASRFAVLLAACQALLGRLCGCDGLLLGVAAAGRSQARFEDVAGYFVNLLPLPADLVAAPTFAELVGQARRRLGAALAAQDLPFPVLVERLQPRREPGRAPLVQAALAWEQPRDPALGDLAAFALGCEEGEVRLPGGLVLAPLAVERRTSELDLEWALGEVAGRLAGRLTVDADLFDPATAARLAGQLGRLLAAAVAGPGQPLAALPLLSPGERAQLLAEWNDTTAPVPPGSLLEAVFAHARTSPLAVAVEEPERRLTYGELAARARALAPRLRALGAGPERPVAVHLERSAAHVVAQVAALAAGAPFVALDPEHPPGHLDFLLADSRAAVRVTSPELRHVLGGAVAVVVLGPRGEELDGAATEPGPASAVDPGQPAYVIYTSGSTGRPKGVACTHRAALNMLAALAACTPRGFGGRSSWWGSPGFDVSILEVYSVLAAGGTVLPVPPAVRLDGPRLLAWMTAAGVTCSYLPPFLIADLAAASAAGGPVPPFAFLVVGVEPLPAHQLAAIAAALPHRFLLNGYGPTESTVCTTVHIVDPGEAGEGRAPIGRPLRNLQVRLLDAAGEPVPVGVPGELWIGGLGIARGYWRDPERTAERFRPDPFAGEPGARLYGSGDRVRWLADGEVEFLGRIDRQVKVRGVRVEPAAVEAALREHPAVREAAVEKRGDRLVAWVAGEALDAEDLRAHLDARLPAAMVPSVFVPLPALPVTVHGKIDRRALPAPPPPPPPPAAVPRTELERRLAALFAEALGVERVGVDQSFFELGGHSLQLARVHVRLVAELGREIPMTDLFQHPTIAGLAAHLAEAGANGEGERRAGSAPQAAVEAVRERAAARRAVPQRSTRRGER